MQFEPVKEVSTDVLVIGAGGAGLRAAIEARKEGAEVLVVSKSRAGLGNCTAISKAGFAVACGQATADNSTIHHRDTVVGGRFLNDQHIVEAVVRGSARQVSDLQSFGVRLNKQGDNLVLLSVPGHTYPRQVTCQQGLGIAITIPMKAFAEQSGVRFLENILITRLLVVDGIVTGAVGIDKDGQPYVFYAKSTILACGGLGQVYLNTNNTADTTGDGYALAYEAGASLADMEFVQFYPTAIGQRAVKLALYEVIVCREGGVIRNSLGEDVLIRHGLSTGATMTRDRVSRAVMQEIVEGRSIDGKLILDLSSLKAEQMDRLQYFLPGKSSARETKLLVSPTTHFAMGGVRIDTGGATGLPGLFAAGEVTSGMHGANRLGGNAITEILVMGTLAGKKAAERARVMAVKPDVGSGATEEVIRLALLGSPTGTTGVKDLAEVLKKAMWYHAGIIRTKEGLENVLATLDSVEQAYSTMLVGNARQLWDAVELGNMVTVSRMIGKAALERTESRGSHYRQDHPEENNGEWLKNIIISKQPGRMALSHRNVEMVTVAP